MSLDTLPPEDLTTTRLAVTSAVKPRILAQLDASTLTTRLEGIYGGVLLTLFTHEGPRAHRGIDRCIGGEYPLD